MLARAVDEEDGNFLWLGRLQLSHHTPASTGIFRHFA